jgi:hypothetical protein
LIKKQHEKVYNWIVCRNILIGAHSQFSGNCYVPCDSRSVRVINNNMLNVLYYVNYNIYVKQCPVLADIIHEMYA